VNISGLYKRRLVVGVAILYYIHRFAIGIHVNLFVCLSVQQTRKGALYYYYYYEQCVSLWF